MQPLLAAQYQQLLQQCVKLLFGRRLRPGQEGEWLHRIKEHLLRFDGGNPERGFVTTVAQVPKGWLAVIHRDTEEQFAAIHTEADAALVHALSALLHHRGGIYRELLRRNCRRAAGLNGDQAGAPPEHGSLACSAEFIRGEYIGSVYVSHG
jgi:hypothetical protein